MATEEKFPTIRDFRDLLNDLVGKGFGHHPAQILVVPDSTLQALARHGGQSDGGKPALMMEWQIGNNRMPVSFTSTDRMQGRGMPSSVAQ